MYWEDAESEQQWLPMRVTGTLELQKYNQETQT